MDWKKLISLRHSRQSGLDIEGQSGEEKRDEKEKHIGWGKSEDGEEHLSI